MSVKIPSIDNLSDLDDDIIYQDENGEVRARLVDDRLRIKIENPSNRLEEKMIGFPSTTDVYHDRIHEKVKEVEELIPGNKVFTFDKYDLEEDVACYSIKVESQ